MEAMQHSAAFLLSPANHNRTYALVVLNQRLPEFAPLLWNHARVRVCADGGANRLFDEMPRLFPDQDASLIRSRYIPDAIKGDMDSVRTGVLDFYKKLMSRSFSLKLYLELLGNNDRIAFLRQAQNMNLLFSGTKDDGHLQFQGSKIINESHDQDTTDLHKCVVYLQDFTSGLDKSKLCILVTGALGGRFDHEVGNINVLCRFPDMRITLLSNDCLIHLLPKNQHHEIHILSRVEGPHCGLIPIGTPSRSTTTTGLQWNLTNTEMEFGGLVSTSNIVEGDTVTVHSDADLLWTISIKKFS